MVYASSLVGMSSAYLFSEQYLLAAYVLQQSIETLEISQCLQLVIKPFGHARVPFLDPDGGICSHGSEASRGGKVGSRVEAQSRTRLAASGRYRKLGSGSVVEAGGGCSRD